MVKELIADGYTEDEVADLLVARFGMDYGDAHLLIDTELGGSGDVVVLDLPEYEDEETMLAGGAELPAVPGVPLHSQSETSWED